MHAGAVTQHPKTIVLAGANDKPNRQQRRAQERNPDRYVRPGVCVAYLHPGEVAGGFNDSLTGLIIHDARQGKKGHIIHGLGGGTLAIASGPRVAEGRSQLVDAFLNNPTFAGAEWMLMLDSDMTFEPDLLDRLVATSIAFDADVVGGLCFAGGHSRVYPTIYAIDREDGGVIVEPVEDYPRDAVVKVGATGAAAILIRRRAFLALALPHPQGFGTLPNGKPNAYPWFVEGHVMADGRPLGEDIAFCIRVNGVGGTVYVDTAVKLGHVKTTVLTEDTWIERRAMAVNAQVEDAPAEVAPAVDLEHAAASR